LETYEKDDTNTDFSVSKILMDLTNKCNDITEAEQNNKTSKGELTDEKQFPALTSEITSLKSTVAALTKDHHQLMILKTQMLALSLTGDAGKHLVRRLTTRMGGIGIGTQITMTIKECM
jgi:hypothetical protein